MMDNNVDHEEQQIAMPRPRTQLAASQAEGVTYFSLLLYPDTKISHASG